MNKSWRVRRFQLATWTLEAFNNFYIHMLVTFHMLLGMVLHDLFGFHMCWCAFIMCFSMVSHAFICMVLYTFYAVSSIFGVVIRNPSFGTGLTKENILCVRTIQQLIYLHLSVDSHRFFRIYLGHFGNMLRNEWGHSDFFGRVREGMFRNPYLHKFVWKLLDSLLLWSFCNIWEIVRKIQKTCKKRRITV